MPPSGFFLPEPGDVVGSKYEVIRHLGRGAMGLVVEAHHRRLDRRVALKFLLPSELDRPDAVERFEREARAASRLRSHHAVRVFDVDTTDAGLPFIVMECLDGCDLGAELRTRGSLPPAEAVDIVLQACGALEEAHSRGVIHRDVKPSNLFLARNEDGTVSVKVTDFGIAKLLDGGEMTRSDGVVGTPQYMAPEQILRVPGVPIDHRIDVWALGVVLYRALAGRLPFDGEGPTQIAVAIATSEPIPLRSAAPDVSEALCDVVMKALARSLDARWPDVTLLATALEPFGSGKVSLEKLKVARRSMPSTDDVPTQTLADASRLVASAAASASTAGPSSTAGPAPTDGPTAVVVDEGTPPAPAQRRKLGSALGAAVVVAALAGAYALGAARSGDGSTAARPAAVTTAATQTGPTADPTSAQEESPSPTPAEPPASAAGPTSAGTPTAAPSTPPRASSTASQRRPHGFATAAAPTDKPPRAGTAKRDGAPDDDPLHL